MVSFHYLVIIILLDMCLLGMLNYGEFSLSCDYYFTCMLNYGELHIINTILLLLDGI